MASKQNSNLFSNPTLNEYSNENSNEKKNFVMKMLFAKHLLKVLPDVVREKCYGCQVAHPSPRHHNVCLMMTNKKK